MLNDILLLVIVAGVGLFWSTIFNSIGYVCNLLDFEFLNKLINNDKIGASSKEKCFINDHTATISLLLSSFFGTLVLLDTYFFGIKILPFPVSLLTMVLLSFFFVSHVKKYLCKK